MTHSLRRLWLASAALTLIGGGAANAQSFVTFGDSLSDNGNLFAVSRGTQPASPPYFAGRFSNGPVFTEILAGEMQRAGAASAAGVRIDPNRNQNYAFGGARTDRLDGVSPPGIPTQIDLFVGQDGRFATDDIVTLYGGANNIFQAFALPGVTPASLAVAGSAAADDIAASATRLSRLGAPTLVVLNLPDLGNTPQFNGTEITRVTASGATRVFNDRLAAGLTSVAAANPGTDLVFVDVLPLFAEIGADPARFGFTNVTQGCLLVPACASAPAAAQNQYLFFDTVHPTAAGHQLFAGLVSDYLGAGQNAGDAGSMSEVAFHDRLAGESAIRERARKHVAETNTIAQGADVIEPAGIAPYWGSAYLTLEGSAFDREASGAMRSYDHRSGTLRLGGDYRVSEGLLVGGAVSAMQGDVDGAWLDYDTQSFSADLYGTAIFGAAFATLSGGVAHFDFDDFERQTAIAAISNRSGHVDGFAANIGIEAGYALAFGAFSATPTLGLTYAHVDIDGFAESGAGARIAYGDQDRDVLYGAANLHLAYAADVAGRPLTLTGRVGYEDTLSDGGSDAIAASVVGSPQRTQLSALDDLPGRGVILGLGAKAGLTDALALGADYSLGLGDEIEESHVGRVSLSYRF